MTRSLLLCSLLLAFFASTAVADFNVVALNGTWKSNCVTFTQQGFTFGELRTYTFKNSTVELDQATYFDGDCLTLIVTNQIVFNMFDITASTTAKLYDFSYNLTNFVMTFSSDLFRDNFSRLYGCTISSNPFALYPAGCGSFLASSTVCPTRYGAFSFDNSTSPVKFNISDPFDFTGDSARGCATSTRFEAIVSLTNTAPAPDNNNNNNNNNNGNGNGAGTTSSANAVAPSVLGLVFALVYMLWA